MNNIVEQIEAIVESINPAHRIDITLGIEAKNTNPNGDPDRDNRPRTIARNGATYGMMTGVCIKNKIRKFLSMHYNEPIFTYNFQVKKDGIEDMIKATEDAKASSDIEQALVHTYIDIRMFGSVLTYSASDKKAKFKNFKPIQGPLQVCDAITLDPVKVEEITITSQQVSNEDQAGNGTFGSKFIIDHGLYETTLSYNPNQRFAESFSKEDFKKLLTALVFLGSFDQAANRKIETKYVAVFQHDSPLGNCQPSQATGRNVVQVVRQDGEYTAGLVDEKILGLVF